MTSTLSACRECQQPVSATARACPHCGAAHPVPLPAGCGVAVGVAALLVVLLVVVAVVAAHLGNGSAVDKLRKQNGPCLDSAGVSLAGADVQSGNEPGSHMVTLTDGAVFFVAKDGSVVDGNSQADTDMGAGGC